jgi:hypothetical protein
MKFILGLIFGVGVTFSAAWYLTYARDVSPAEPPVEQSMAENTALPVEETPAFELNTGAQLTTHDALPPQPEEDPAETTEQPTQSSEPVWTVFHSEASASGFANYLSQSINHPFEVTKLGPAQYQVSYSYSSSEQAQMLAAKVKLITGTQ